MYGQELASEKGKRHTGVKPNPGTIYLALKSLVSRDLVKPHLGGHNNVYELTTRPGQPVKVTWIL